MTGRPSDCGGAPATSSLTARIARNVLDHCAMAARLRAALIKGNSSARMAAPRTRSTPTPSNRRPRVQPDSVGAFPLHAKAIGKLEVVNDVIFRVSAGKLNG